MSYPTSIPGYELPALAKQLSELRYDALATFLWALRNELRDDAYEDEERGRHQLAEKLALAEGHLEVVAEAISDAWKICEPHMRKPRTPVQAWKNARFTVEVVGHPRFNGYGNTQEEADEVAKAHVLAHQKGERITEDERSDREAALDGVCPKNRGSQCYIARHNGCCVVCGHSPDDWDDT